LPAADTVRATKARAPETSRGLPGIVTEPRIADRCLGPDARRLARGVSICACLPMYRIQS
jgi:hypothetical protein